jgi:hypothetical protein
VQVIHTPQNLNLNHFEKIESMGFKIIASSPLEWHHLTTKFHKNLPIVSNVDRGRKRHADSVVISLAYFFL